jgi:hypothetical protein
LPKYTFPPQFVLTTMGRKKETDIKLLARPHTC